jgi:hypothetical protein
MRVEMVQHQLRSATSIGDKPRGRVGMRETRLFDKTKPFDFSKKSIQAAYT